MTPTPQPADAERLRVALGNVSARLEHDWECASLVFGDACDCGRDKYVTELVAAVRAALVAEIVGVIEAKHRNAITRPRKDALDEVLTYLHGLAPETDR